MSNFCIKSYNSINKLLECDDRNTKINGKLTVNDVITTDTLITNKGLTVTGDIFISSNVNITGQLTTNDITVRDT